MKNLRAASLVVAVALLSACGQPGNPSEGSSLDGTSAQLVAASADATTEAGTALMTMQMTMTMPQGQVTMDAEGAYDFANNKGEMFMTMELPEEAGGMGGTQTIDMVFEDLVVYMKYPMMSQFSPEAKPWIRMDLEAMGRESGMDFGSMMQSGTSDPSQMLEWLRGVSGDVEVVGEEEVRGAPAIHYKGTIDFNKVADQAPAEVRDRLRASISTMRESIGASTVPFDVWIDEQGRAVRMQQSFTFTGGESDGASMSMTVDIFDFGTEVDVRIPPASQTSDFQDAMGSMSGSSGSTTP